MTAPSPKTKPPRRKRQKKRQSADVVKIIVTGLANTGKTSFIRRVSQYTEWRGEEGNGWFFGRVRVDSSLILHFYEPPIARQYDFMWLREVMSRLRATGFVVMADSTKPQYFGEFLSILYTIRGYHENPPLVVAANKQDESKAWHPDDIRLGLGIRDVSVMPCNAHDHNAVRQVVIDLLYQVLDKQD
ncbi:MAG: hypothetical protein WBC91_03950 [Phototrophicaceae bacterium]